MNAHPSELALERHLLDPVRSAIRAHVETCDRCGARVAEMQRQGEDFLRFVFPATVEKVEAAAERSSRRFDWIRMLAPASAVAAAAAVFLLVRPAADHESRCVGEDCIITKGEHGLGMTVFLNGSGGARPARDGEVVPAGGAIRFRVRPAALCNLWVLSVDASGQVSRLFPMTGDGGALVATLVDLPGGAVLDGKPGPERIFAICTPAPMYYATVERAVQVAMARGESAVRSVTTVPGLPEGTGQASILLEKR